MLLFSSCFDHRLDDLRCSSISTLDWLVQLRLNPKTALESWGWQQALEASKMGITIQIDKQEI